MTAPEVPAPRPADPPTIAPHSALRHGAPETPPAQPEHAPPESRDTLIERLTVGRPPSFPSVGGWLRSGIYRNARGVLGGLVAAWFYVPSAGFLAVATAIYLGFYGLIAITLGPLLGIEQPDPSGVPVVGDGLANLTAASGGMILILVAVFVGFVGGFILGLILVVVGPFQEGPLQGVSTVVGAVVAGFVVGLLYTLYRVFAERRILMILGARRLSRREAALLSPIVADCARRLGLQYHPPVLIDDSREPNAVAYTRHIVINQGLLEEFHYDREAVAAVVSHELVHWRNGDPISAAFVRGVALPLYLMQAGAGWLLQRAGHPVVRLAIWFVFWPVFITVRYLVMPLQAADARQAEYRADQGAVLTGHRDGMRLVLTRFRRSFETGRNGWDAAVCAVHPPNELRLERLEEPGGRYLLPDEDAPPLPLPVVLRADG